MPAVTLTLSGAPFAVSSSCGPYPPFPLDYLFQTSYMTCALESANWDWIGFLIDVVFWSLILFLPLSYAGGRSKPGQA
jgi:hypothetical protein